MSFLIEVRKNKALFIMTIPATIALLLFHYLPMFGVIIAFKDYNFRDGFLGSPWIGFKNFKFLFVSGDALAITRNTILYNLAFIILGTLIAIILAIVINELGRGLLNKVNQTVLLLPHFLSWIVVGHLVFAFLSADKGFINVSVLKALGVDAVNWYGEKDYWPGILFFTYIWKHVGYSSIIYIATITSFDSEYYEAAKIDGATSLQQAIYITVPLLKPIITIMVILALGKVFNSDFGLFYIIPRNSGALFSATRVLDTYIYDGLKGTGDIGMAAAAGLYQAVVGFIFVLVSNMTVKKLNPEQALF